MHEGRSFCMSEGLCTTFLRMHLEHLEQVCLKMTSRGYYLLYCQILSNLFFIVIALK
jgi:hypothetical protein